MSGIDRRSFFRIVAASGAATAAAGCGPTAEKLYPFVSPPENIVPGIATYFATVCRECPAGCGVVAKNREGRVVKLEGNPDHPVSAGTLCIAGHAALQGLYHPDRFRGAIVDGKSAPWESAEKIVADKLGALGKAKQGSKIAVVTGLESGSVAKIADELVKALGARPRIGYEPLGHEAIRAANRATFGRDAIPEYAIAEAGYLLSFGADFLDTWLSPVEHAAAYTKMHALSAGKAGTYVHVEPRLSQTAANADEWVRNAPGTRAPLALAMLKVIVDEGLVAPGVDAKALGGAVGGVDLAAVATQSGVPADTIKRVAHDLAASKTGLVLGGGAAVTGSNATDMLQAINLLNVAIGAVGKRVRFGAETARPGTYADMVALTQAMAKGEIEVLILGDVNPLYTMPPKAGFAEALAKVPMVVSLANRPNETTAKAHVVLPALHWLESWGDVVAEPGVVGLMQPAMGPVEIGGRPVDGRSLGGIFLSLGRQALGVTAEPGKSGFQTPTFADYVKAGWAAAAKEQAKGRPFTEFWEESLRRGGVWRESPAATTALRPEATRVKAEPAKLEGDGTHVLIVYPSPRFYDGRRSDRAWLQEAPDTMTQVAWDGWVELPGETANRLGVVRGDLVTLTSPHGRVELPAYPVEALHPAAVAVAMGQGHAYPGEYAQKRGMNVGANPVTLLGPAAEQASGGLPYLAVRVQVAKGTGRRSLAVPQATFDQDHREIAQTIELGAARELELRGKPPEHASHPSMYPAVKFPEYRWGMTVDLDRCTGIQV